MAVSPVEINSVKFTPKKVVDLDAFKDATPQREAELKSRNDEAAKQQALKKGETPVVETKVEPVEVEETKVDEAPVEVPIDEKVEEKKVEEKVDEKPVEQDEVEYDPDLMTFDVDGKETTVSNLISQNRELSERVAKIEGNEFLKKFNEHVINGGDPRDYLESQAVNWKDVPDLQVLKQNFDKQNSDLDAEAREELFAQEIAKYGLSPDGTWEDENTKTARVGKQLMQRDAKRLRDDKIAEQAKFKIQERQAEKAPVKHDAEAEKQKLLLNEDVKSLVTQKLIRVGDTDYGYEVENVDEVVGMMADVNKFWAKFSKDGKIDTPKLLKVMAFAANPDKYDKDVLSLAMDLGQEKYMKEQKNTKDKVDKVVDTTKDTDNEPLDLKNPASREKFMEEALRQHRAKQKR